MTRAGPTRWAVMNRAPLHQVRTVDIHPIWLRFPDPELDREFREQHDQAAVPQAVLAGVLAIALYAAFGILDAFVVRGDLTWLFVIRFAVVCPFILVVVIWALMSDRAWMRMQPAVCVVVVVAAYGLDVMPFVANVPIDYSRTGSLLILMFLFAFARVRFLWAMATTVVVVAGYQAASIGRGVAWENAIYNNFFLAGFIAVGASASYSLERLRRREFLRERALQRERERSDDLLHNILPEEIAARLREERSTIAEAADHVTVLFADIVDFTPFAETLSPHELVTLLDGLFTLFDDLCGQHGVEKIKTIGDAYMAVAGVPRPDVDHAGSIAELALGMQDATTLYAEHWPGTLALRIGVASGPVVAGVIGHRKFAYDLWGDTVNTASRLESHATAGRIHVDGATRRLLAGRYAFSGPQQTNIKGKGVLETFYLRGRARVGREDGELAFDALD